MDFTSININSIDEQDILLVKSTATNHYLPLRKALKRMSKKVEKFQKNFDPPLPPPLDLIYKKFEIGKISKLLNTILTLFGKNLKLGKL